MQLPPGLVALVRILPRLVVASAVVYAGLEACDTFFGYLVPKIPAYVLSLPLAFAARVVYAQIRDRRQAALLGAVLPPSMNSKLPGGLDKLSGLVWNFSNGHIGEFMEGECEEVGQTLNARLLYENRIFTTEPEYIKAILATQFNSFVKGPIFWDQFHSLLGTGVFDSDGDIWKFHRSMTRPFFSRVRISDFDIFEKHAEDTINQMKIRFREGYPVDFQDAASRFTLDSATEFLFGKDVSSLSAGLVYPPSSPLSKDPSILNHPANRFARAFSESQVAAAYRANYGSSWRFTEPWQDQVLKRMKICSEFIDPILADTLAKKHELKKLGLLEVKDGEKEVKDGETLLEHLVNYTEDRTIIKDEALNIMIAGRDTTAATLTFAIYMLSQHPDVLARLRDEILTKVGSSRKPTHDDMRDMKYLRACINETLRLYPAVPFNVRLSTEAQVWPALNGGKPFYIPPNTMAIYSVFLMHRRKDMWGPDADHFDPDRFLDERLHKYLIPNPFIFLPFNAGPRICLGQQFAYHEVSYFLIRLLQSFDAVSLDMETQHLPPANWTKGKGRKAMEKVIARSHLTIYVEGGLWTRMKEASPVESA
ncbi:cytochrome P450 [Paxillus ammoniavirescens]|nr:cytochrome P450 [Paxillus ammoniavirescens]